MPQEASGIYTRHAEKAAIKRNSEHKEQKSSQRNKPYSLGVLNILVDIVIWRENLTDYWKGKKGSFLAR
jgi:hypothetical protein